MKLFSALLLVLGVPVWGETLVLTVRSDNGDPGEERRRWTQEYFTDDLGHLVHTHFVSKAAFADQVDFVDDQYYHWESELVWWEKQSPGHYEHSEVRFSPDGLEYAWEIRNEDSEPRSLTRREFMRFLPGSGLQWSDGTHLSSWSNQKGYQRVFVGDGTDRGLEITTSGSRLSSWYGSRESDRLLLNRTPRELVGTYYGNYLEESGWVPTGEIHLVGRGFWNADKQVNLAHLVITREDLESPLLVPFILEQRYLR